MRPLAINLIVHGDTRMNFKEIAERSPVWTAAGLLVTGFVAAFFAFAFMINLLNLEMDKKATACPEGKGGITIETYPLGANIEIDEGEYSAGMCVSHGRVTVGVVAEGFAPEKRLVHVGEYDQIIIFELEPLSRLIGMESSHVSLDKGRVTVNFQGIALSKAIRMLIEAPGPYKVEIDRRIEESDVTVDLQFTNMRWGDALAELVDAYDLRLDVDGWTFLVSPSEATGDGDVIPNR